MYCALNGIHEPIEVSSIYYDDPRVSGIADTAVRNLAAMTLAVDTQVGKILSSLDGHGIKNDTIVVFVNDNGGLGAVGSSNSPLRGGKGSLWEGGMRVPFMMQWPAEIPGGQVVGDPVIALDLLPTFLAAANGSVPAEVKTDGVDLLPLLKGETSDAPHDILFWRTSGLVAEHSAVRKGDWKLHRVDGVGGGTSRLFNLVTDPAEATSVLGANPAKYAELLADLTEWESEITVPMWGAGSPTLSGVTLLHAELGYELTDPTPGFGYAMIQRRTSLPVGSNWTREFSMDVDAVPSARTNGYFVVADGAGTGNAIRLGIDEDVGALAITEEQNGAETSLAVAGGDLPVGVVTYTVSYDSAANTLSLSYGAQAVVHVLTGSYGEFSYEGYALEEAISHFSPAR